MKKLCLDYFTHYDKLMKKPTMLNASRARKACVELKRVAHARGVELLELYAPTRNGEKMPPYGKQKEKQDESLQKKRWNQSQETTYEIRFKAWWFLQKEKEIEIDGKTNRTVAGPPDPATGETIRPVEEADTQTAQIKAVPGEHHDVGQTDHRGHLPDAVALDHIPIFVQHKIINQHH